MLICKHMGNGQASNAFALPIKGLKLFRVIVACAYSV